MQIRRDSGTQPCGDHHTFVRRLDQGEFSGYRPVAHKDKKKCNSLGGLSKTKHDKKSQTQGPRTGPPALGGTWQLGIKGSEKKQDGGASQKTDGRN